MPARDTSTLPAPPPLAAVGGESASERRGIPATDEVRTGFADLPATTAIDTRGGRRRVGSLWPYAVLGLLGGLVVLGVSGRLAPRVAQSPQAAAERQAGPQTRGAVDASPGAGASNGSSNGSSDAPGVPDLPQRLNSGHDDSGEGWRPLGMPAGFSDADSPLRGRGHLQGCLLAGAYRVGGAQDAWRRQFWREFNRDEPFTASEAIRQDAERAYSAIAAACIVKLNAKDYAGARDLVRYALTGRDPLVWSEAYRQTRHFRGLVRLHNELMKLCDDLGLPDPDADN